MLTRAVQRGLAQRGLSARGLLASARRSYSASSPELKVAIIGAGPSGFYAASRILQLLPAGSALGDNVKVDLYERLPTPYGLVRYGVAPDHPEVKNCQHKFDDLAADPRFAFFGNTSIGTAPPPSPKHPHIQHYTYPHALHLPLDSLTPYYNAVIFTYGASLSNPLSTVAGSSSSTAPLKNVFPALAFVGWYNGHPAFADLNPDLGTVETVDVVGQGNVALDVARILLSDVDSLRKSDLPEAVLETLARSRIKRVRAVGRRGPAQVAFTTKELREMTKLPGVDFGGVSGSLMEQAKTLAKGDRMRTRQLALMEKPVTHGKGRGFELDFLKSPRAFLGDQAGKVRGVEWELNDLVVSDSGASARPTGRTEESAVDMVVESVGYRSEGIYGAWSAPFDTSRGRLANIGGRLVDGGEAVPGAYAAGWVARGPVGVIASTMQDAYGLVDSLLDDFGKGFTAREGPIPHAPMPGRPVAVEDGVKTGAVVDLARWQRIDAAERELGKKTGREEREKFRTVEEMLGVE